MQRAETPTPAIVAVRCLAHPASLGAVAVFFLNDDILKPTIGRQVGWLTGKLCDFAGLFFFPLLLALALSLVTSHAHRAGRISLAISALLWSWAKTTATGNAVMTAAVVPFVGHITIVRDPSDVLALVMLWPVWRLWNAKCRPAPAKRIPSKVPVVIAALACGAHHADFPDRMWGLVALDSNLYVIGDHWYREPSAPHAERGGVLTANGIRWLSTDLPPRYQGDTGPFQLLPAEVLAYQPKSGKVLVSPIDPSISFRIRSPDAIEESRDGGRTWRVVFDLNDRGRLIERQTCGYGEDGAQCRASVTDIAFFPDGTGALAVTLNLPTVAIRSPAGVWSLVGDDSDSAPQLATFEPFAIVPETSAALVATLLIVLLLRNRMTGRWAQPLRQDRPLLLFLVLIAPSVLLMFGWWLMVLETGYSPAAVVRTLTTSAVVVLCLVHGSKQVYGSGLIRFWDLVLMVLSAGIAFCATTFEPWLSLVAIAAIGLATYVVGWRAARVRYEDYRPVAVVGRAALLLPMAGFLPFLLWSGGIVPRYWMAAALAASAMVFIAQEAWRDTTPSET